MYLQQLRNREKVQVEECVKYKNMADQKANLEMTSILAKFRAGQPLGISGRSDYHFDQVLKNGDSLDKPLENDLESNNRNLRPDDALVAFKRLEARIQAANKALKADIKKTSPEGDAKAEPQAAAVNNGVENAGKNAPSPEGAK